MDTENLDTSNTQRTIIDDINTLMNVLPPCILDSLRKVNDAGELLEVVVDLGRAPSARFTLKEIILDSQEVNEENIEYITSRIGSFGSDNRAGIERTLHRISAIRNRSGRIVGLTCRVGRAVLGTVKLIEDLVQSDKSILLLGRPGVGKTTMLREVARVLADDLNKRVIVVDTSNEIAGDGDIPHPAIGKARRMQVSTPLHQHAVMIEAVENHMPQAIVIDEIGTELEASASRTIAERGVQLVGTAHGNTLNNLILNPTLCDLVGGIHSVTLGDEEARRRGTQKSVLERKAPPTFEVVVELQDFNRVAIHLDVGRDVDSILKGHPIVSEVRWLDEDQTLHKETTPIPITLPRPERHHIINNSKCRTVHAVGVSSSRLEQAAKEMHLPVNIVDTIEDAEIIVTSKQYYRRRPQKIQDVESANIPVYVVRSNAISSMKQLLESVYSDEDRIESLKVAIREAEEAAAQITQGEQSVELSPQNAYIRRMQHLLAERYKLTSHSVGKEPRRRVTIYNTRDPYNIPYPPP